MPGVARSADCPARCNSHSQPRFSCTPLCMAPLHGASSSTAAAGSASRVGEIPKRWPGLRRFKAWRSNRMAVRCASVCRRPGWVETALQRGAIGHRVGSTAKSTGPCTLPISLGSLRLLPHPSACCPAPDLPSAWQQPACIPSNTCIIRVASGVRRFTGASSPVVGDLELSDAGVVQELNGARVRPRVALPENSVRPRWDPHLQIRPHRRHPIACSGGDAHQPPFSTACSNAIVRQRKRNL